MNLIVSVAIILLNLYVAASIDPKADVRPPASHHVVPSSIGIRNGFPDLRVGTEFNTFRFHPHSHGIYDKADLFTAFSLSFVVRQACLITAVFNPIDMLYLGQTIFGYLSVFIQSLFKMTAYMYQALSSRTSGWS